MDSSSSLTLAVISGPMALASMLMQVNTEGSTTHDRVFLNTTHTHTHCQQHQANSLSATSGEHQGVSYPRRRLLKHMHCQQHQVNTEGSTTHNCLPEHNTHTVSNISWTPRGQPPTTVFSRTQHTYCHQHQVPVSQVKRGVNHPGTCLPEVNTHAVSNCRPTHYT